MTFLPNPEDSVSQKLKALVASGTLSADDHQVAIARRLDHILSDLVATRPARKSSALGWLFASRKNETSPLRGLYVYGGVGRGKTMLMDLFFDLVPIQRKRRTHFHAFMADVHDRIHAHRQKLKNGETRQADPIPPVAASILSEARLLCFDEFTVTDIADAMILSRLFTELFAKGCVVVATSNVEPDNLYRDGLNRGLFLPFVKVLKEHTDIVSLDSDTDYRLEKADSLPVWSHPLGPAADANIERAWRHETLEREAKPETLSFRGRTIQVPAAAGHCARFTFSDLCEKPLGAADFLAILGRFDTLFVEHIPLLSPERRNETKRFILLVDTLYDHGARIFASAAAPPEKLLAVRKGTEGFEFDRTVSRLIEMQSGEYSSQHESKRAAG